MKLPGEETRFRAAGLLGQGLSEALFLTTSLTLENEEHYRRLRDAGEPLIFVCWHDQLLPLVHAHRHEGIVALVSDHADGEYLARLMVRQGFETARGSSTRGGTRGLRQLARAARRGKDLAVTPDGPRGPRHRVKEGALMAARISGLPLVPLAAGASSAWRFPSWDRFMVPRPFARIRICYGAPVRIPRTVPRDELRTRARELEETLRRLTARAGGEPTASNAEDGTESRDAPHR